MNKYIFAIAFAFLISSSAQAAVSDSAPLQNKNVQKQNERSAAPVMVKTVLAKAGVKQKNGADTDKAESKVVITKIDWSAIHVDP